MPALKTVEPINEVSVSDEMLETLREQAKVLMAQIAKATNERKATNASRIADIRYEAWQLDSQLKPLYERRAELATEHGKLTGIGKIRISDDEKISFLRKSKAQQK